MIMKHIQKNIYYSTVIKGKNKVIKIDVTDIFCNKSEIAYRLELRLCNGKIITKCDCSLEYLEENGEYLIFSVFDLRFIKNVLSARLIQYEKDECGKEHKILYNFPINIGF